MAGRQSGRGKEMEVVEASREVKTTRNIVLPVLHKTFYKTFLNKRKREVVSEMSQFAQFAETKFWHLLA